jgi:twin BRCT domain
VSAEGKKSLFESFLKNLGKLYCRRRRCGLLTIFLLISCVHRDLLQNRLRGTQKLVSPLCLIESCRLGILQNPSLFPLVLYAAKASTTKTETNNNTSTDKPKSIQQSLPAIFRGNVFVLQRVAPPDWAVDFDLNELERIIVQHGGQLLTTKLLAAIKADRQGASTVQQQQRRTCYVISWGEDDDGSIGRSTDVASMHPLLAQIKRQNLCTVEVVSPIWLQTCREEQTCLVPSEFPELFQQTRRPIHRFHTVPSTTTATKSIETPAIRISVTGFAGVQRTAITLLIQAMCGIYDDALRKSTTYLICTSDTTSGPKYETAIEWNLRTVTLEWLLRVARHGLTAPICTERRPAVGSIEAT